MGYMATFAPSRSSSIKSVEAAAEKVGMVVKANPVVMELYGYCEPMLDTNATLRRVALFAFGSGRTELTGDEKMAATAILDYRFDGNAA